MVGILAGDRRDSNTEEYQTKTIIGFDQTTYVR